MRIIEKKRKTTKSRKIGLVVLIIGISTFSAYLGVGVYIMLDMSSYNQDLARFYWWDSDDCAYTGNRKFKGFYDDANWTFLEEKAYIYENWTDTYSICNETWNCATTIVETIFEEGMASPFYNDSWNYDREIDDFLNNETSKFRIVEDEIPIAGYGDSPMWTGNYMASLAFHYAVACEENNANEANEILRKLKKPVDGLHILTHITGLDGNLVRFAIKDTGANRKRFVDFFYSRNEKGEYEVDKDYELQFGRESNRYPGQGKWDDWWYEARTSRDQHIGFFFGNGITYKLLSDSEAPSGINEELRDDILDTLEEDATDVLDCLIGSNWHVINGEEEIGGGRGHDEASLHPRIPWTSGGDLILAFLSVGNMMDSDKYGRHYDKILNRFLSSSYHFAIDQSGGYYGNNLAMESIFLGYFLQKDSAIKELIRLHFNEDFYEHVQYHRNAFFNLGYLIINDYDRRDILQNDDLTYRLDDITDNLDLFGRWRFPSRDWYIPDVDDWEDYVHPKAKQYSEIFAEDSNHILKVLYGWIFNEFSDTSAKMSFALGADELGSTDFIWQRGPFGIGGTHPDHKDHRGEKQHAGVDYTLPYWMARYYEYFKDG